MAKQTYVDGLDVTIEICEAHIEWLKGKEKEAQELDSWDTASRYGASARAVAVIADSIRRERMVESWQANNGH